MDGEKDSIISGTIGSEGDIESFLRRGNVFDMS